MHAAPELPIVEPTVNPDGFACAFLAWRGDLERARAALAPRTLGHVDESVWLGHFAEGTDPVTAVLAELERFD